MEVTPANRSPAAVEGARKPAVVPADGCATAASVLYVPTAGAERSRSVYTAPIPSKRLVALAKEADGLVGVATLVARSSMVRYLSAAACGGAAAEVRLDGLRPSGLVR